METGKALAAWRWLVIAFCLSMLGPVGRAIASSVTLFPSADTSLFANFPDNNLGANSNFVSGENGSGFASRALIRFDLASQVPSNAVIQSVTLRLTVVIVPAGGGAASVFDLRKVLVDWVEGVGTGNTGVAANDGETTWNNRFHPLTPWTSPGGAISNDFSGTVSASNFIDGLGIFTFNSTANLVADVQSWLLDPSLNFGWVMISESEGTPFTAKRFGSREDPTNAAALVVQYSIPTEILSIKTVGNQIQFSFLAAGGQPYTIQYSDSAVVGNWQTLTNIPPPSATTNVTVSDPIAATGQRYYRVGAF